VHGYFPDFWCPKAKLAVEIDGAEQEQVDQRDAVRDTVLFTHGIHTVHVPSDLVWNDPDAAIELIRCAVELQRGPPDA